MSYIDLVYEKVHHGHDPRWLGRAELPGGRLVMLCIACLIEIMEDADVSAVRKSVVLTGVNSILRECPGAMRDLLLLQDHRLGLRLAGSLLGLLHDLEVPSALEQAVQALVQLLLELQSEQCVQYVLEEIQAQICDRSSLRGFLPLFNFLGKLLDAIPTLSQTVSSHYVPLLEQLSLALLVPDEVLKTSVCYVFQRVCGRVEAAQAFSPLLRDRLCTQLLHELHHTCSPQLTVNCVGLLKELLKFEEVVTILMNQALEQDLHPSGKCCTLPLVLKKLLLSGDEMLQIASAQCMAAILVHSPRHYCPAFIQADIPEFLCEHLCSQSEVLLWSLYSCLLLMTEEPLFFSQCHSVYGIEPLVRSLREALMLSSVEVQKQGLVLLTEILNRQPVGVRLFPTGPGFVGAVEVVTKGISSPCLQVATHAASAATALFRVNHQSNPVQYRELKRLVGAVIDRCAELPLPTSARMASRAKMRAESSGQHSKTRAFLLQAVICFQAACRLAEDCAGEPGRQENAFTAPGQRTEEDTLEAFCQHLLLCCDASCIPTVLRHCEGAPSASLLQHFFTILSSQFSLLPAMMPLFSAKLASSGFVGLSLEYKAAFCAGSRNPGLNAACSDFLHRLSMCLLSMSDSTGISLQGWEEGAEVLRRSLPTLCCRVSEWPSLMREESAGLRATQYSLLLLLQLALRHGDRLLPDPALFSCTVSVLEQGDAAPPSCVLHSALYLLSVTQENSPDLTAVQLSCIRKALSQGPGFSSLYTHSPALLRFVFRYPELAGSFGLSVMELWLTHCDCRPAVRPEEQAAVSGGHRERDDGAALLALLEERASAVLALLGVMCTSEPRLADGALRLLGAHLQGRPRRDAAVLELLRPRLLQALQRLVLEQGVEEEEESAALSSLALVLRLLCLTLAVSSRGTDMDGTDFKLLFHVSNLAAKLKSSGTQTLLPALNYLYCCLSLSPAHCADRVVSVMLCNATLMEQLQTVLRPSSSSSSSLLCCARLLLCALLSQRLSPAQIQKKICLNLDEIVHLLVFNKHKTDSIVLAGSLRLLQTLLDLDLQSPLLILQIEPSAQRPLLDTEAALQPLGSHRARCLVTALHGLLLQKQDVLLSVSVSCLASLLGFLHRRSPLTAVHVVRQPWSHFLLFAMLNSGETSLLHPASLTLLTLLVHFGGERMLDKAHLTQVFEAVEKKGVKDLGGNTAQALKQLLTQLQEGDSCLSVEQTQRAQALLGSLSSLPAADIHLDRIISAGELSVCRADFTLKIHGH